MKEGWDALAAWRDELMGEDGDLWHRGLIDPSLLEVVGSVRGQRVLDVGCGNGYLTRRWARQGASRSLGIDASRATLARARRRETEHPTGAEFLLRQASDLRGLADRSFDLVVANMALFDIEDAEGTVREVARVLAAGGRFVFSIGHPCFELDERSAWVVESGLDADGVFRNRIWRKVHRYREERSVRVPWPIARNETGWTTSYHRTLATYSRLLRDAGLAITRLEEPAPDAEVLAKSPQGPYLAEIPLHLIVEAAASAPAPRVPEYRPARRSGSRTSVRTPRRDARRSGSGGRIRGSGSTRRGSTPGS